MDEYIFKQIQQQKKKESIDEIKLKIVSNVLMEKQQDNLEVTDIYNDPIYAGGDSDEKTDQQMQQNIENINRTN